MKTFFNDQHKYNVLDEYLKSKYNSKVFKVALNGNFSCPNRDGTLSFDGCIFCSPSGSGDFAGDRNQSLADQFIKITSIIHQKWPNAKYIIYFQANTNTYAPLEKLKELYEEAILLNNNIVGISIATRPDCLNDNIVNYLSELNSRIPVWIELGLQTIHSKTARLINRGYELETFEKAVTKLRQFNIETIVHIINGLPYETIDMMLQTIDYLNKQDIQGIKIHSLFILKNTNLADMFEKEQFNMQTLNEYVTTTSEQLSHLRPDIIIHRINGDAPKQLLIEPQWSLKKLVVMNEIDKYMKQNNYYQGSKYIKQGEKNEF